MALAQPDVLLGEKTDEILELVEFTLLRADDVRASLGDELGGDGQPCGHGVPVESGISEVEGHDREVAHGTIFADQGRKWGIRARILGEFV